MLWNINVLTENITWHTSIIPPLKKTEADLLGSGQPVLQSKILLQNVKQTMIIRLSCLLFLSSASKSEKALWLYPSWEAIVVQTFLNYIHGGCFQLWKEMLWDSNTGAQRYRGNDCCLLDLWCWMC